MKTRLNCLLITLLLFTQTSFAQRYTGEDPTVMMDLKNIDIMGMNIDMPMSDILATLKAQGLSPDCSRGIECLVRTPELIIRVQHAAKSLGNRGPQPVDPTATPIQIGFSQQGGNQSHCAIVEQVIAKYCANSVNRQPCWTDNFGQTSGHITGAGKSPDGYLYNSRVALKKGQFCSLSVKRLK